MTFEIFDIVEKEDEIHVFVQISYRNRHNKNQGLQKLQVKTNDIVSELLNRKISHGKTLSTTTLKNYRSEDIAGTWIFEKKKLDKSAEKVILSIEEEKPASKNKSKAKKKTSK
tara:strand:+ start:1185 stop:1523 length:339 start_codon:yes stop_codon:yes gene_type:complete